ncbi:MAG: type II toxin-antitoxin system RelE/ParE family toxin [Acidobacteria bacterium]|nr:type II toxin-antitoxin system RelE/ParE family toxin [Acidobacteriota bacterium]MYG74809.1 type II toxin-antitoxin system RelE/ParE family toxin [Acidobacteriota bacterium]
MLVLKRVPARFYRSPSGAEPVRDWLRGLSKQDRRIIGTDIKTVEYGWPIGMPVCRPLGDGIFETRSSLRDRIARVLFCIHENQMILLHGFIKKANQIPKRDLDLARTRGAEMT